MKVAIKMSTTIKQGFRIGERKVLPGFIIGGHSLNNVTCTDVIVLIAYTERKP